MLRPILLISLFTGPVVAISCYSYSDYTEVVETAHHRTFCTAVYDVSDGIGAFGGGDRHPSRIPNIVNLTEGNDCVRQLVNNKGLPSSDYYLCYCFQSMCNFPFTWEEFVNRGHTLKPKYVMEAKN
ncbi:unnamed protein product [Caenorhabditis nigoni]